MKAIYRVLAVVAVTLCMPISGMAAHSDYGCDSCHTPHHANKGIDVPLWNGHATASTFTLYSSESLDAVPGQPDGSSKLCLACHDGSNTYTTHITSGAGSNMGTDLSVMHPISFTYDSTLATADGGLKDPTAASGIGGTIAHDYLDSQSKVQCASCHDVHTSGVGTNLLRGYDYTHGLNGGALCRVCHLK